MSKLRRCPENRGLTSGVRVGVGVVPTRWRVRPAQRLPAVSRRRVMVKAGTAGWSKGATGGPNAHHDCRRKREEETDTDRAPPEPVDADAPVGWCRRDRLRGFAYVNSLRRENGRSPVWWETGSFRVVVSDLGAPALSRNRSEVFAGNYRDVAKLNNGYGGRDRICANDQNLRLRGQPLRSRFAKKRA